MSYFDVEKFAVRKVRELTARAFESALKTAQSSADPDSDGSEARRTDDQVQSKNISTGHDSADQAQKEAAEHLPPGHVPESESMLGQVANSAHKKVDQFMRTADKLHRISPKIKSEGSWLLRFWGSVFAKTALLAAGALAAIGGAFVVIRGVESGVGTHTPIEEANRLQSNAQMLMELNATNSQLLQMQGVIDGTRESMEPIALVPADVGLTPVTIVTEQAQVVRPAVAIIASLPAAEQQRAVAFVQQSARANQPIYYHYQPPWNPGPYARCDADCQERRYERIEDRKREAEQRNHDLPTGVSGGTTFGTFTVNR